MYFYQHTIPWIVYLYFSYIMVFDIEVLKTWFIVTRWLSFAVQWLDYRWKTSYRGTSSILHRLVETAYEVHLRSWPVSTVSFSSELITPTWPFLSHIFYIKTTCTYLYFGTRFRALETVENGEKVKWRRRAQSRTVLRCLYSAVIA